MHGVYGREAGGWDVEVVPGLLRVRGGGDLFGLDRGERLGVVVAWGWGWGEREGILERRGFV